MRPSLRIAAFAIFAIFSACGSSSKSATEDTAVAEQPNHPPDEAGPESASTGMHHAMKEMCPMAVEGTTMAMEEVDGAMAMVFTNPSNAAEVQRRAKMMAGHHQKMAMKPKREGHGEKASHEHGSQMGHHEHGSQMGHHEMMAKFTLSAEDTETGARLLMTPDDPAQLDAMRAMMKKRHAEAGDKPCPMMMMGEPAGG